MDAVNPAELLKREGDVLKFPSRADLQQRLPANFEIPRRAKGRRSYHRETRCLARYLHLKARGSFTLGSELSFPMQIVKRESPDFLVVHPAGKLGLEITEAGTEKHQAAMSRQSKLTSDDPAGRYWLVGESEIISAGPLPGRGYCGDECERGAAEQIITSWAQKRVKLKNYERFARNELVIYENTHFPNLDWQHLARCLEDMRPREVPAVEFDEISIFGDGPDFLLLTRSSVRHGRQGY